MRFKDIFYINEDVSAGDEVVGKDKLTYIVMKVNDDGTYDVVDKDTKKNKKTVDKSEFIGVQQDMFSHKHSVDDKPIIKQKNVRPKKLGTPEKVSQTSFL